MSEGTARVVERREGFLARLYASRSRRPFLLAALAFIVLSAINTALQPTFLTYGVAVSNLAAFLPLTLLAIGQTFVILGADIDLSNGGIVSLVNVVVVIIIESMGGTAPPLPSASQPGLRSASPRALQRLLRCLSALPGDRATFATSIIFIGLALWVLPQAGGQVPASFYLTYAGNILGIPTVLWIIVLAVAGGALVMRPRFAQSLRAVGGNAQSAFQTGIPVSRVRLTAYVMSGLFSALAGLALVGETASGDPLIGGAMTLSSVTAVVLGGTALTGCVGSITGSILGAFMLGIINNIIFFAHVPFEWQGLIQGAIILAALSGGVVMARQTRD